MGDYRISVYLFRTDDVTVEDTVEKLTDTLHSKYGPCLAEEDVSYVVTTSRIVLPEDVTEFFAGISTDAYLIVVPRDPKDDDA